MSNSQTEDHKIEETVDNRESHPVIDIKDTIFYKYYKALNIIQGEDWDRFIESCKTELPSTFRVSVQGKHLTEFLMTKQSEIQPINWLPNNMAWQLPVTRRDLKKKREKLHSFVKSEADQGNITRQELVSMIPVLLLDIKPDFQVVDMCASPGSKTSQIIDALYNSSSTSSIGVLIANDLDIKRCHNLINNLKRAPSAGLVVTNNNAATYPNIHLKTGEVLQFDRILSDVPCSSDGTIRKTPDILRKWNQNIALGLHPLQIRILKRSIEMLRVGGRVVYSSCSFNPIENEAVVSAVLNIFQGKIKIVDVSEKIPGLKFSKGLETWDVLDEKRERVSPDDAPGSHSRKYPKTLFPDPKFASQIKNTLRIYPHLQDTGGFYIAVIEKIEPHHSIKQDDSGNDDNEIEPALGLKGDSASCKNEEQKLSPFLYLRKSLNCDSAIYGFNPPYNLWESLVSFYGIKDLSVSNLYVKSPQYMPKTLFYSNDIVTDIVTSQSNKLKVVFHGFRLLSCDRLLERDSTYEFYRPTYSSAPLLKRYLTKRCFDLDIEVLKRTLVEKHIKINDLSEASKDCLSSIENGGFLATFCGEKIGKIIVPYVKINEGIQIYLRDEIRSYLLSLDNEGEGFEVDE